MSNYNFVSTLDGLNNINADGVNSDNISTDYLMVNIDSSVPLVTPYTSNTNQIASTAFVQSALNNINLSGYALLNPPLPQLFIGSTNTFNSVTNFNGAINNNSTVNVNNGSIQNFFSTNGTNTRLQQTTNSFQIVNGTSSQSIQLASRTSGGSPVTNLVCQNGNTCYMQGDANNRITVSGSTTPTISTQAPALSNDLSIANTAWVNTYYGKLTLASGSQLWTGNNRFSTNGANLPISLLNIDVPTYGGGLFIASGGGQYNANTLLGDTVLMSTGNAGSNSGALSLTTWSSTNCGIRITNNTVTYNGNHNFNGNISLALYNLDVLNSARTRGLRISNNGANNGVTDINGVGVSTRFNFFSNDGAGVASNNFYIFNGNTCYLQGAAGLGIGLSGANISLDGICSFTNTTTPTITQSISLSDNSNKISTTGFVKNNLLDYVTLNTNQTITANKTFNGNTTLNNLFVSNYVDLTLTTYENQFYGDIYGYRGVVCQNGFYVKDTPGPGGSTYALIDSTGNISTTTTISATGDISSSANLSGANISTLGNVTTNQLLIKDPSNPGSSSISQTGNTLTIGAISNNVTTPQTTLTLAVRSSTNSYSEILNGNTTNLILGNNSINTNINSTNFNIQSSNISITPTTSTINTSSTSTTLTGGQLVVNNDLTTFNDTLVLNGSTETTNTLTFYDGANTTQFEQNNTNLTIYGTSTGGVKIGSGFNDNIVCVGTNRAYLQGTIGNTIDITGTQATIGGSSVPKITTQPLAASNTNEIATTQWSKTQLSGYATLNGNNTFTGLNNFTKSVEFKDVAPTVPIVIKNTASFNSGGLLISASGSYNGINSPGDFSVIGFGPIIDTGVLTLTTHANSYCGIKIDATTIKYNAPFSCWYYTLPTVPPLNVYDVGYMWEVSGSTFNNWTGFITTGNIATVNFDGIGGRKLGVWRVDIVLCTENTGSPNSKLIWTTVGPTSNDLTKYCINETTSALYGLITVQVMRLSFTLKVTTIPSTYYLNYYRTAGVGSGFIENKTNSHIQFTRIA